MTPAARVQTAIEILDAIGKDRVGRCSTVARGGGDGIEDFDRRLDARSRGHKFNLSFIASASKTIQNG